MNFLILGDGSEELAWGRALAEHPEHRLWAACPGFEAFPDLPGGPDLDGALAVAGVEAVVVGGGPDLRAEGLRRAAADGFPSLCLHPPGPGPDAYYQVALSRRETGAIVVPDLPGRLHPGVEAIRRAIEAGTLGATRGLRYEVSLGPDGGSDLLGVAFPRAVDVVRGLLGEVESLTASGDPPGDRPTEGLLVVLRGSANRRAEVRLTAVGSDLGDQPDRLSASGEGGTLTLEFEPDARAPARLIRTPGPGGAAEVVELAQWDPREAMLKVFAEAVEGVEARPDLLDATRSLELAEAAGRSLRRGRTIELHYEEISEVGTFKSLMTSAGCLLLFGALALIPVALVGPALGLPETIYLAYAIPPVLIAFLMLQVFRLAIGRGGSSGAGDRPPTA